MSIPQPHSSSSKSGSKRIDLSLDSPTFFRSRRHPCLSPNPKKGFLPTSPPVGSVRSPSPSIIDIAEFEPTTRIAPRVDPPPPDLLPNEENIPALTRSEEMDVQAEAGPSKHPTYSFSRVLEDVEDVSDSQWDAALLKSEARRRQRQAKKGSSSYTPSSPLLKPVQMSDTPPQSSIRTPVPVSPDDTTYMDNDPGNWPESPDLPAIDISMDDIPILSEKQMIDQEKEVSPARSMGSSASPQKNEKEGFTRLLSPESVLDMRPEYTPKISDVGVDEIHGADTKSPGSHRSETDLGDESSTLEADQEASFDDKENQKPYASLTDLFADDRSAVNPPVSPLPPPRSPGAFRVLRSSQHSNSSERPRDSVSASASGRDRTKATIDPDEEYDYDDISFPDCDFDVDYTHKSAGPSTSPIRSSRPLIDDVPQFYSSPINPPPVTHPIMLISDLPPDVQDFYNNHWRRGAENKRKAPQVAVVEDWSDVDEAPKPKKKAPTKGGNRSSYFRGRGRFFRGRGRGRGGARKSG